MKKVSIIVPVYNVEKELENCLLSLVNQTLSDIEIIVVNDYSPDGSEEIIKRFAESFPDKIISVKKENGGLSDARNLGIVLASGEYIAFVDSDDSVEKDFCEKLYLKAKKNDFDVVTCDVRYIYENSDSEMAVSSGFENDTFTKEKLKENYISFFPAAWNKLYKREFLAKTGIFFMVGVWFEDVEFWHRLYPYLSSVGVIKEPLYRYLQRKGSVTSKSDKRLFDYIPNFESIIKFYKEKGLFEEYYDELSFASARYLNATFLKRAAKLPKSEFKVAVAMSKKLLSDNFPDIKKNPYLKKCGLKGLYIKYCGIIPDSVLKLLLK